jgi:hypothetical protein
MNVNTYIWIRTLTYEYEHLHMNGKFEDTKGVTKSRKLKKDRQHNETKGQTTIYKSLHITQWDKRTNNYLQIITHNTMRQKDKQLSTNHYT